MKRAYWHYNNQWKHVYIIERYVQTDIFGDSVEICRVRLTAKSTEIYEVEAKYLEDRKPRKSRGV